MITTRKVTKEMIDLQKANRSDMKTRQINAARKRIAHLKTIKYYLDTNPTEDFLRSEIKRLENRYALLMPGYPRWDQPMNKEMQKVPKAYEKEMGIDKIKEQLKCLRFILSKD